MKEQSEAKSQSDRELRERLKRQRDKEIERAIKEIQQETSNRENEEHRAYEAKMKLVFFFHMVVIYLFLLLLL